MNTGDTNTRRDDEEPQAPARLVAALKEPPARRVFVPPAVDEAVIRAARQHLTQPRPSWVGMFRSWLQWFAFAAACIALAGLVYFVTRPEPKSRFAREDINRDGQVDILDAFQLARDMQSGKQTSANPDLNSDGVLNDRDAEAIAMRAVKLEKGGRS